MYINHAYTVDSWYSVNIFNAGLVNMNEAPSDDLLSKIKFDLANVVASQDLKKTPEYSLKLMEAVFVEMEIAFKSGATQRQVFDVFAKHNVYLPFTRFAQNLIRLRHSLISPTLEVQIETPDAESISAQMLALKNELIPTAKEKTKPNSLKKSRALLDNGNSAVTIDSCNSDNKLRFDEQVLACSKIIVLLATDPSFSLDAATRQARSVLGSGWTPQSVVQFVSSARFGQWCLVPWPGDVDRSELMISHRVACAVTSGKRKLPSPADFKSAIQKAFVSLSSDAN